MIMGPGELAPDVLLGVTIGSLGGPFSVVVFLLSSVCEAAITVVFHAHRHGAVTPVSHTTCDLKSGH